MNYDLVRPCDNCPFRVDCLEGWLGEERAEEIIDAITAKQATFACHKTTEAGGKRGGQEQHCAGAMIMLEKLEQPNQMMRIMERLGGYDRTKLDMDAPVFDDPEEFIAHHAGEEA